MMKTNKTTKIVKTGAARPATSKPAAAPAPTSPKTAAAPVAAVKSAPAPKVEAPKATPGPLPVAARADVAPKPATVAAPVVAAPKPAPAPPVEPPKALPVPAVGRVSLELIKPGARAVYVAGSFNDWRPERSPLSLAGDGKWVGALSVEPGRHEYLFVVDGEWLPDPNAKESVLNPFGGCNSVLIA